MYHQNIWSAIDQIAKNNNLSCSALAIRAGLDATLFNQSKRFSREGKPHTPSLNTVMKLVYTLGLNLSEFERMMFEYERTNADNPDKSDKDKIKQKNGV